MGGIPFVPGLYDYRPGERIADLIMRSGDIAAQRQARSGEIWGGAVNQLGQIASEAIKKHQEDEDQKQVGGAISAATAKQYPSATQPGPVGSGAPIDPGSYQGPPGMTADMSGRVQDPGADHIQTILQSVDPKLRPSVMRGIQDFNAAQDVADERQARLTQMHQAAQQASADAAATLAHGITSHKFLDGPDGGLGSLIGAAAVAKQKGAPWASAWDKELGQAQSAMQQAQAIPDPDRRTQAIAAVADTVRQHFGPLVQQLEMSASPALQEQWQKDAKPIIGHAGDVFIDPYTRKPFATVPDKPPKPGTFEYQVTKKFGPNPTPEQIAGERKNWAEEGHVSVTVNPQQANDVKEAVTAMREGTAPPLLPGRASKEYLATMAEAHRQGFDLATAATDWVATQKHIASMNSNSQLKLNQAINQLPELLDSVDSLASQWKGGRFPVLNKANLAAANAGVYGPDVAAVAKQLQAQIADVTADLGNVYMGGNSPTDHALDLASKALGADWDEKVLHKMVALARSNVETRSRSIRFTGVAGASAGNPYGNQHPAESVPPPTTGGATKAKYRYDPASGKLVAN